MTYNSHDAIGSCLESMRQLASANWADIAISIVDNNSTDDTVERIEQFAEAHLDLRLRLTRAAFNPGWGAGNNIAADAWNRNSDYLLLYNPDASIDAEGLRSLLETLEAPGQDSGAAVPYMRTSRGLEVSARPRKTLPLMFVQALGVGRMLTARKFRKHRKEIRRSMRPTVLRRGYPSGAMLLVKRSVFEEVGRCDPAIFLYCDDADLGKRLMQSCHKVMTVPKATALHDIGMGSALDGEDEFNSVRESLMNLSELAYVEKWYGPRVARAMARTRVWPYYEIRRVGQIVRGRPVQPMDRQKEVFRSYLAGEAKQAPT